MLDILKHVGYFETKNKDEVCDLQNYTKILEFNFIVQMLKHTCVRRPPLGDLPLTVGGT